MLRNVVGFWSGLDSNDVGTMLLLLFSFRIDIISSTLASSCCFRVSPLSKNSSAKALTSIESSLYYIPINHSIKYILDVHSSDHVIDLLSLLLKLKPRELLLPKADVR